MESKALEALHVAAKAIAGMDGITESTADNDNNGGEVIFTTASGREYTLRLVLTYASAEHVNE